MSSARKLIALVLVLVLGLGACAGDKDPRPTPDPTPIPTLADAGVGSSPVVTFDPSAGHLDDGPNTATGVRPPARRATRPIELMLRSTPNAARVYVDGEDRGLTPVLWQGETGDHIFAFVKKDHAMARYRFWASTNGVVHARLDPVVDDTKPGAPQPLGLVPPKVPPPPTLLTPDAPVLAVPVDAAAPVAPAVDAALPIDAAPGSPIGPPF